MKFAHLADTHLGRQKDEKLRSIEKEVFQNTIDEILKNQVDFVLIAGDFFDINIPDMETQKLNIAPIIYMLIMITVFLLGIHL